MNNYNNNNNYNTAANSDCSDNYSTNSLVINDQNDVLTLNGVGNSSNGSHSNTPTITHNNNSSTKYDKLVQDYVKLRSKLTILKKAYVELSETSSQKDQSLRKYEQEIEGLNFRNQQLTSRVEILQRELESFKHSPPPLPPSAVALTPTHTSGVGLSANTNAQSTSNLHVINNSMLVTPSASPSSGSLSSSSTSTSSLPTLANHTVQHQQIGMFSIF